MSPRRTERQRRAKRLWGLEDERLQMRRQLRLPLEDTGEARKVERSGESSTASCDDERSGTSEHAGWCGRGPEGLPRAPMPISVESDEDFSEGARAAGRTSIRSAHDMTHRTMTTTV